MLSNLKLLKRELEEKNWTITSFLFHYNQQDFVVLVKLYIPPERKPDYALVKLHFMKANDLNDELEIPANSNRLMTDAKTLRSYFDIEYAENLGDILQQFTHRLGQVIPETLPARYEDELQVVAMVHSLSKSDSENPNKIYCNSVRRNPDRADGTPGQRSPFNSDKTKLLRPSLYEKLKSDKTLSFCYYDTREKENTDETIIYNWTKRKESN